ncbi:MAG: molybdopterin-binding protein [Sphingobacteriales bacterium]|nr:MAG: molybdopterin-binding protein [Sphingobacteriales bacterium]
MKKYTSAIILFLFLTAGKVSSLNAQEKQLASIKISGAVEKPITISAADLNKMPRIDVSRIDKNDKAHQFSGVLLSVLLTNSGANTEKALHGENLTKYVVVEAVDGYKVVFSLAELDQDFSDNKIVLADTMDSAALAVGDGPFKIIVQNDKRPARYIKQVKSIRVVSAK